MAEVTAVRDWTLAETGDVYRGELRSVAVGGMLGETELNCEGPAGEPFTLIVDDLAAADREWVRRLLDGRALTPGDTLRAAELAG